jgi:hypothetical protein
MVWMLRIERWATHRPVTRRAAVRRRFRQCTAQLVAGSRLAVITFQLGAIFCAILAGVTLRDVSPNVSFEIACVALRLPSAPGFRTNDFRRRLIFDRDPGFRVGAL